MSAVMGIDDEDDDYHSLSSVTNSDDNLSECNDHTHRSCSRFQSCNKNNHHCCSINITPLKTNSSKDSKPVKGDTRSVENEPGHQQKFDGSRWRRVCCAPNCCTYLNGGVYYNSWLCKKHYLLALENDAYYESDNSLITDKRSIATRKSNAQGVSTRLTNKRSKHNKRGDIMVDADGIRQKYDGMCWRPVCSVSNCKSFVNARGLCYRHDTENRKKKSEVLSTLNNIQPRPSISESQIIRSSKPAKAQPRKGEIRSVRQQWNGTKWYSLCNYNNGQCQRRSGGAKSAFLCEKHFREFKSGRKERISTYDDDDDFILLSPTIKRKKLAINIDNIQSRNMINETNCNISSQSLLTIPSWKAVEQSIQTVVTYSVDSSDLRQGCILVDDDNDNDYQCDSPEIMAYVKQEEEEYPTNQQKFPFGINSLPINCKLELTEPEDEY